MNASTSAMTDRVSRRGFREARTSVSMTAVTPCLHTRVTRDFIE